MNSISALITVIFIVLLSIVEIEGYAKSKAKVDTMTEKSLLDNVDSLATIQYKVDSVADVAIKQKNKFFEKM